MQYFWANIFSGAHGRHNAMIESIGQTRRSPRARLPTRVVLTSRKPRPLYETIAKRSKDTQPAAGDTTEDGRDKRRGHGEDENRTVSR